MEEGVGYLERPILLALLGLFGAWLVRLPFRSLKTGSIQYKGNVYERNVNPFWFWFYTVAAGIGGVAIIVASIATSLALFSE